MNNYRYKHKGNANFDFTTELYDKWRKRLYKTYLLIAAIISLTEFIIFFFDDNAGLLYLPVSIYLTIYWIIPSVFNFSVLLITRQFIYSDKYSQSTKNTVCAMQLFAICSCSALIHYVFAPIMCAPCIAIFITVLFADKKLTLKVFILSLVLLAVITVEAYSGLRKDDPQLFLDTAVAVVLAFSVFLSSNLLTNFSKEQFEYLSVSYKRQTALMNEMRMEPMTGLYNRLAQHEIIRMRIKQYENIPACVAAVAMLDIDFFKQINDTYGHLCGDEVIIYLAELLRKNDDEDCESFRFGGEEFIILFNGKTVDEATEAVGALCRNFGTHAFSFSETKRITLSCGIAAYCGEATEDEWIEKADAALYQAKNSGRNKIVVYKPEYSGNRLHIP